MSNEERLEHYLDRLDNLLSRLENQLGNSSLVNEPNKEITKPSQIKIQDMQTGETYSFASTLKAERYFEVGKDVIASRLRGQVKNHMFKSNGKSYLIIGGFKHESTISQDSTFNLP